jgi:hypothetical protein
MSDDSAVFLGDLISVSDIEIVRVTEWVVRCRLRGSNVDIPRGRIVSSDVLIAGERMTLSLPSWFAYSVGLATAPDGTTTVGSAAARSGI